MVCSAYCCSLCALTQSLRCAAWLHHTSDVAPSDPRAPSVYVHPSYEVPWDQGKLAEARPISSYDPAVYMPPGYLKHPGGPRRYETVQRWQPPGGRGTQ